MDKIKIAVTGGIGSGKSTALKILKELGGDTFSCDEIYKEIFRSDDYIKKVGTLFSTALKNNQIDREILSKLVFQAPENRKKLNELAHPLIMRELYNQMEKSENKLVFAEVPLLFEENLEAKFDKVIVIVREKSARIQSVKERDGLSQEKIEERMRAQFSYDLEEGKKRMQAINAFVIDNVSVAQMRIDLQNIFNALSHL